MNLRKSLYWCGVLLLLLLPLISIGDNLGMYYDAVFPDYAATQILASQEHQERWFAAFPVLCQVYHGTISLWISLAAIVLTGTTSVLQHHIVYALVIFVCFLLMNRIFAFHGVPLSIRYAAIAVMAVMPTVMTFTMTQYYIELPGVVILLAAAWTYEKARAQKTNNTGLYFAAFALIGLAAYNYFNFLFFFPGAFLLYFLQGKSVVEKTRNFLVACWGTVCGAVLYLAGLCMMLLRGQADVLRYGAAFLCAVFIWLLAWIVLRALQKNNVKGPMGLSAGLCVCGLFGAVLLWNKIRAGASSLGLAGTPAGFWQRVRLVLNNFNNALRGTSAEELMYQQHATKARGVLLLFFVGVTVLYLGAAYLHRHDQYERVAERYLVTLLLYFCCCMVLITRMQTQHFVPLVFWAVMICTFELAQLAKWMAEKSVNTNLLKGLGCAIFLALISLNAMNRYRVVDQILRTGGKGKYTSQINVMSEQALQNANAGEKEFYLFPEWGFMAGFNYITRNTIAFSSAFELEDIRGYLDEGYEIEILTWEEEKIPEYLDAIESLPDVRIEQTQYMQNDGQVAFYKLEVTQG